jgi:hypothetical protein
LSACIGREHNQCPENFAGLICSRGQFVLLSEAVARAILVIKMKIILSLESATQLAVFLENRPGALARVCEALAKAGVNIHALTVSDTVDHAVIRMIVSDATKALMLLGERGVLAFEKDVLCIDAANELGVLGKIADALSRAEVNIEYAYFATGPNAPKGIIVLRPSNVEKARQALTGL